ncbi:MAG TPA: phosphatase PAP2 family protein [Acidimicrobiales bacterium]|nr:phosphatase PAP2 family protein [Acidimicrobiales bacterium]
MDLAAVGLMVVGVLVLTVSVVGALPPRIHPREQRVFRLINRLPGWLYWPLWVPMQLGNLAVGTLVGLVIAWQLGDWRTSAAVIAASVLKLVSERVIRNRMADHLAVRQRPGTSQPGAILRGSDVPSSGPSFPSGHVILVAAISSVVGPDLALGWIWVPVTLVLLVMTGRVYVGAHNPLDVTAGLGAGLVVGGLLELIGA